MKSQKKILITWLKEKELMNLNKVYYIFKKIKKITIIIINLKKYFF